MTALLCVSINGSLPSSAQDNCQLILFSQNYHLNDHRWLLNVKLKLIKLITANGKYVIVLNTTYMQETEKQTKQKLHCVTLHTHKGYLVFFAKYVSVPFIYIQQGQKISHPCLLTSRYQLHMMTGSTILNSAWWDKIFCWQLCSSITNPLLLSPVNQKSLDRKKNSFKIQWDYLHQLNTPFTFWHSFRHWLFILFGKQSRNTFREKFHPSVNCEHKNK